MKGLYEILFAMKCIGSTSVAFPSPGNLLSSVSHPTCRALVSIFTGTLQCRDLHAHLPASTERPPWEEATHPSVDCCWSRFLAELVLCGFVKEDHSCALCCNGMDSLSTLQGSAAHICFQASLRRLRPAIPWRIENLKHDSLQQCLWPAT